RELTSGNLDDLLIRENWERILTEIERLLLVCCPLKSEVHSTRARECHPFDLPFLCHLESGAKHVEVSLKTTQWASPEAKPPATLTIPSILCFSPIFRKSAT